MDKVMKKVEEYVERGAGLIPVDLLWEARYDLISNILAAEISEPYQVGDHEIRVLVWTRYDPFDHWHVMAVVSARVDEERRMVVFKRMSGDGDWALFDLSILPPEVRKRFEEAKGSFSKRKIQRIGQEAKRVLRSEAKRMLEVRKWKWLHG